MRHYRSCIAVILAVMGLAPATGADTVLIAGHASPGSPHNPSDGMGQVATMTFAHEGETFCAAVDSTRGFAYFCNENQFIKVAVGGEGAVPTRSNSLILGPDDGDIRCTALDATHGRAYLGTDAGAIVEVDLGSGPDPMRRVGAVNLGGSDENPVNLLLDEGHGFLYAGTSTHPGRVVKYALGAGDATPSRVATLVLASGEDQLGAALIDPSHGYAYYATNTRPGHVVKVALGTGEQAPARVASFNMSNTDPPPYLAAMDATGDTALFTTGGESWEVRRVVKLALGAGDAAPTRVGDAVLGHDPFALAADAPRGRAYAGILDNATLITIDFGAPTSSPSVVEETLLEPGDYGTCTGVVDASGVGLFGVVDNPGRIRKVDLRGPHPTLVGSGSLVAGEYSFRSGGIDPTSGYAYYGSHAGYPGLISKVATGTGDAPPVSMAPTWLDGDESWPQPLLIDSLHGYGYTATQGERVRVVKFALGAGDAPVRRVGSTPLTNAPGGRALCGAIDPVGGRLLVACQVGATCHLIKLATGDGDTTASVLSDSVLPAEDGVPLCSAIDPVAGHAYLGSVEATDGTPGRVVKYALGAGDSPPTRIASVPLPAMASCAIIDPEGGEAWFGGGWEPPTITKVRLGPGDSAPEVIGSLALSPPPYDLVSAAIDTAGHAGYFLSTSGHLAKVDLGAPGSPPTLLGSFALNGVPPRFRCLAVDPTRGYLHTSTDSYPASAVKIGLDVGSRGQLRGTRVEIPGVAVVRDVRFHSHAAAGNVRLAIYDNASPRNLLWQSHVVANTATNAEVIVPIDQGTPETLNLGLGTYWLAWQVDASVDIPSYSQGSMGDGFVYSMPFGEAPRHLGDEAVLTGDVCTEYLTYTVPPPVELLDDNFQSGREGWRFHDLVPTFVAPESSNTAGDPGVLAATTQENTNTFGWWESPVVGLDAPEQRVLRATCSVSSDRATPDEVPTLRIRATTTDSQQSDLLGIESHGPASLSPTTTPRQQVMYWLPPPTSSGTTLSLDVLNFYPDDAPVCRVTLDSVVLEQLNAASLSTGRVETEFNFDYDQGFAAPEPPAPFIAVPRSAEYFQTGSGRLVFHVVPASGYEFCWWGSPEREGAPLVRPEAGRLYLADFTVGSDQVDASLVPCFRLRVNESRFQASQCLVVPSTGNGANSPTLGYPRTYTVVFPAEVGVGGYLIFSMDLMTQASDGDSTTAQLYLENLRIRSLPVP